MAILLQLLAWPCGGADFQWRAGDGFRQARLAPIGSGRDGFRLISPAETGILFTNWLSEQRTLSSQILPSGSGVAAGDVDGDGLCDLYFCALRSGNRLYRNLGNWRFEDISVAAGVTCSNLDATAAALVDFDADGDLDLIINSVGGGAHLFVNDSKGRFTASAEVLNLGRGAMSMALADCDGDGWLDLYVANYRVNTISDMDVRYSVRTIGGKLMVASINGKPLTAPEWTNRFRFQITDEGQGTVKFAKEELGEADALFRNLGNGRFQPVPWTEGNFLDENGQRLLQPPFDWGLSAMFRDLNQDGRPDLYVCNDFNSPDRMWLNIGQGRFQAIHWNSIRQIPFSAMTVDAGDVNGDGFDDLFVSEMLSRDHGRRLVQRPNMLPEPPPAGAVTNRPQYARNALFLNRGDGTFAEIAQFAGLDASEWSWASIFLDVDLDGHLDLLVANGFARDNMNVDALEAMQRASRGQPESAQTTIELRRLFPQLATPNCVFRNLGGLKFKEVGSTWGFDTAVISQGMCLADLDNDGDLDVVVNNFNGCAGLYRNEGDKPRIAVKLKGQSPNTQGIGARIKVQGGPVPLQSQEIISGGRYLSCDQALRVFAAGSPTNSLRIEVDWPRGKRSVVTNSLANRIYEIDEASGGTVPKASAETVQPFFEDVSRLLKHTHHDEVFDDFARQPTLPRKFSQSGPGISWCDLNGDGWDDLVIAGGKGGSLAVYLADGQGGFQQSGGGVPPVTLARDQTTVLALPGSRLPTLLAGSANYDDGSTSGASVQRFDLGTGNISDALAGFPESVGPLALGDRDGDGNLELFVGGQVIPGRYPEAASSRVYRYRDGKFELDAANSKLLERVGLVSGAIWSDLNGDGLPELLLACDWGPIRILRSDQGKLVSWDPPIESTDPKPANLSQLTGWWNGITTGDLDGDGRLDIIASNWGQNTKYESHRSKPLRLYFADFKGEGTLGLLEAYFEPGMKAYVPERRLEAVAEAMPFLRGQFPSHAAFANATVDEILREHQARVLFREASCLETTVFLNRGDKFERRALPLEAQLSPAFGIVVADYDGDGQEDVFLSQNFFALAQETSRCDAGRGLWLRGDGRGGLHPVPGQESGVRVYGEQRGAAVADFDGDGRVDLVVTQNAAETHLFRNLRGKPGLRVRLKGPPANPYGYGAQLRLKHGEQFGAVREVQGGGGYWSQNSPVQVLAGMKPPSQVWVRWPGGKTLLVDVPADAAEIEIAIDGQVNRLK